VNPVKMALVVVVSLVAGVWTALCLSQSATLGAGAVARGPAQVAAPAQGSAVTVLDTEQRGLTAPKDAPPTGLTAAGWAGNKPPQSRSNRPVLTAGNNANQRRGGGK
jgi:hypothetical protein